MKKNIIVTGGAQGIGKGITDRLLREGYAVVIADLDIEAGEETRQEYEHAGDLLFIRTDVADEHSARECVNRAAERFGRLDGLINNAGIARAHSGPPEKLSLADWTQVLAVNLTGCFLMARECIPHLRQTGGTIINIASTRAIQSEAETTSYSAAKGGLASLTHSLAVSLGPEIRVNCISPGWIDVSQWKKRSERTPSDLRPVDHAQHPAGRVGIPEDVAALVRYLLTDEAGFITGQNFIIDGGMTRKMIYAQ